MIACAFIMETVSFWVPAFETYHPQHSLQARLQLTTTTKEITFTSRALTTIGEGDVRFCKELSVIG